MINPKTIKEITIFNNQLAQKIEAFAHQPIKEITLQKISRLCSINFSDDDGILRIEFEDKETKINDDSD